MKTLFAKTASATLVIGLLASAPPFANAGAPEDGPAKTTRMFAHKAYFSTEHRNHLKVIVVKQDSEPVLMSIANAVGQVVYETKITEQAALHPLNLTNLEPGSYQLLLSKGTQIERSDIEVQ
jgi:hypothetical protein